MIADGIGDIGKINPDHVDSFGLARLSWQTRKRKRFGLDRFCLRPCLPRIRQTSEINAHAII
jgi:hypothetical protein